jgi:hypothetical protein
MMDTHKEERVMGQQVFCESCGLSLVVGEAPPRCKDCEFLFEELEKAGLTMEDIDLGGVE